MKKNILLSFTVLSFVFSFLFSNNVKAQTATTTINYTGFLGCGGCAVCGADYYCFNTLSSYCGNTATCNTKTFVNPVPAGNIVTGVSISYYSAGCSGGSLASTINGQAVPSVNEGSAGCPCSSAPCVSSASSSSVFPCGLPGYNNAVGGINSLQLCTGANVCINRLVLTLTYAPANQATPATQPTAITGANLACVGVPQTYSIPAVANASSYNWTVPAGWTINSGQGTTILSATPGSAGNICVTASNLCGTSAATCYNVNIASASSAPTSAAASPNPICNGASTTLSLAGGSLGTSASWSWYSSSCGGILEGAGTSLVVSPTSSTTYYVRAAGTCNTTACAAITVTVNPIPTANAGSSAVLTCTNSPVSLSGSGGTSYSWTGPAGGITGGAATSAPTVVLPGTYTLVVTSAGCNSSPATVSITQNTATPAISIGTPATLNCTLTSVTIPGGPASGVTYNWSGPGIVSGGTSATPVVNLPGSYNYTTTGTNGCTSTSVTTVSQNAISPSPSASVTGSITCNTNTVTLNGGPSSGVTYAWSGPGLVSGNTSQNAIANTGGSYVLTVTNPANGCSSNTTTTVFVNNSPPTTVASTSGSMTCVSNTINLQSTLAGMNYTWTCLAGSSIISGTNSQNAVGTGLGSYYIYIYNPTNGCTYSTSVSGNQNTSPPTVTVSPTAYTVTCATPTVQLTANSSTSGLTYSWTTSGGSISPNNSSNPTASGSGTYSVVVTNPVNGCTSIGTATIAADAAIPSATLSSTSVSITCANPTPSVAITTTSSPVTYNWSPASGIASGATTANPTFSLAGTYSAVVTNTVSGCSTSAAGNIVTVVSNTAAPTVSLSTTTSAGTLTCSSPSITLTPTVSPSSNLTYTWSGPGISSATNQSSATFTAPGVYSLVVTNTVTGCSTPTSAPNTFTVYANTNTPTVTATAISSNTNIGCGSTNSSITYSASVISTGTLVTYLWSNGSTSPSSTITAAGPGFVIVTDAVSGCSTTTQFTVTGNTTPPQNVSAGTIATMPCGSSTTTLLGTTTSTSTVSYSWSGPAATSITSGSNTANPLVNQTGSYTLTVTDLLTSCSATTSVNVIQGNVTAGIAATPTTGIAPVTVSFTEQCVGASSYYWSFGDNNSNSIAPNPVYIYNTNGTYTVMLIASSGPCSDTAYVTIIIKDGLTLEIPNVFTPNGDDINDVFTIKTTGVKDISLQIFNRWGDKMYGFAGPNAGWDGRMGNGAKATEGTYFFFVKVTGFDDSVIEKNGTVSLFR